MKKIFPALFLFVCLFAFISCTTDVSGTQNSESETAAAISASLLEGYPKEVLPLFQPKTLISCSFSTRENGSYDIGKDIYTITYSSTADQQTLTNDYSALFTELDEAPSLEGEVITDQLSGKIGEYGVEIMFLDNASSTVTVYLTLGLPQDQSENVNPFFKDYPENLAEEFGLVSRQSSIYQEQYYGEKTLHYVTIYQTSLTAQAFISQYTGKYSSKQNFIQSESDPPVLTWQDQAFELSIRYTGGTSPYITIDASKAG